MTVLTEPLPREQKLMLQRLMASHILENNEAKQMFAAIHSSLQNDGFEVDVNLSVEECFAEINQQLTKGFDLEIATVVLDQTKYHAVINSHSDDVSKLSFNNHFDAHDRQLIIMIFQHLVDRDEGEGISRKDLINLRGDLKEPYKLSLTAAEHIVETLIQEQWLRLTNENDENRRRSMQAGLQLAPRTYLELSHLLVDMGIPQDELPQFIFHRL